ncbi:Gat1p [Saccharomyces cerevisiae AWRI796]|nr:Gat1p [Saccharomyces cerevisiae AWRI796]
MNLNGSSVFENVFDDDDDDDDVETHSIVHSDLLNDMDSASQRASHNASGFPNFLDTSCSSSFDDHFIFTNNLPFLNNNSINNNHSHNSSHNNNSPSIANNINANTNTNTSASASTNTNSPLLRRNPSPIYSEAWLAKKFLREEEKTCFKEDQVFYFCAIFGYSAFEHLIQSGYKMLQLHNLHHSAVEEGPQGSSPLQCLRPLPQAPRCHKASVVED